MSQYKVPQDVEAEDHILGPLTLKQFIYAIVAVAWAGMFFFVLKKVIILYVIVVLPISLLFLLLAFYKRDGQNFEQLLIALVGFFANSRKRIWRKEAVVESFHVEAAKPKEELSQRSSADVRAELTRLGELADARGINHPQAHVVMPASMMTGELNSAMVPAAPIIEEPATDLYDISTSPLASNLNALIEQAAADVRTEALEQMKAKIAQAPAHPKEPAKPEKSTSANVTPQPLSDILKLATESDLSVSQLAAQATRLAPIVEGQSVDLRNNGKPS
jgi:hypothetical protein